MPLIKTLSQTLKQDKEKFKVPRSVQQAIPIRKIWPDGIFQVESKFSRTFRFTDINYSIASKADKTEMFLDYSELLNALDSGCTAKITLNNRKINKEEFEQSLLIPMKGDGLDEYRKEYNDMLLSKISGTNNSIYQERYLTVSVHKKNIDEARTYFARVGTDIITHLAKLSSIGEELDAEQRLQIFRDFFKADVLQSFPFDMKAFAKKGHSFKDWICPDTMEFHNDHFKLGEQYGRVLFMEDYASYVKDEMISELCSLGRNLMLSIDIIPVPTDEAVREIQNRLLGVETNVTNWQRRQNANNNFSAVVPYDMELQRKETKEMLDDLTTRDQRMMFGILTMVHMADSKKQLDSDTETLYSIARKHLCQMATLKWQQVDGLNTVLPYGLRKIDAVRTLTTESTAVLIPFHTQEIMQPGGIYYGQNAVSKNMLVADRRKLLNGNSFRLGVSGSGKSFSAKEEIVDLALSTEDDILILDPESEFASLVEALNGEVIRISATSDTHLNALDMDSAYGNDRNPLIEKSEFILSLFEQLVGAGNLSAKEKSILDRCTADVYRDYMRGGYKGQVPTLKDLYRQLMLQPEEEARGLALSSELFINGSLNTFAQETDVNTKSRIISDKEKKITAYHEAGHAILFHVLPDVGPVYTVSIIPTGVGAAGYTMPLPEKDEMFATKSRMLQDIMVSLGGRIAEEIIFGDITTGASSDIKKATKTARRMVTRYGMSDHIGVICYDDDDDEVFIGKDLAHAKAHSEEISGEIDKEVKSIIDDCYTKAKDIILQHEDVLHSCAQLLLEKEKITREEFEGLFV